MQWRFDYASAAGGIRHVFLLNPMLLLNKVACIAETRTRVGCKGLGMAPAAGQLHRIFIHYPKLERLTAVKPW